jgi:hypothetical protein
MAEGASIGRAAARYMSAPDADRTGQRLIVLGDPRTQAGIRSRRGSELRVDAVTVPPPTQAQVIGLVADEPNMQVLRSVAVYVQAGMEHVARQTSQAAMAALAEYETRRDVGDDVAAAGGAMRTAMVAHLATMKGRPYLGWEQGNCQTVRDTEWRPCPNCGWPVRGYRCSLRSGTERRLLTCPRCTDIRDQPLDSKLEVRRLRQTMELVGELPEADWKAALLLIPSMVQETQTAEWPSDESGRPRRRMEMEFDEWPAGSFLARVVMVSGTSVDALGIRMRAPAGAKIRNLAAKAARSLKRSPSALSWSTPQGTRPS